MLDVPRCARLCLCVVIGWIWLRPTEVALCVVCGVLVVPCIASWLFATVVALFAVKMSGCMVESRIESSTPAKTKNQVKGVRPICTGQELSQPVAGHDSAVGPTKAAHIGGNRSHNSAPRTAAGKLQSPAFG